MIQTPQAMMGASTDGVSVLPRSPKFRTPTNAFSSNEGTIQRVSTFSNLANQAIEKGHYREALDYYQSALEDYLEGSPTLVELVNAAATCFNLGALSKKLQDYRQAGDYFCQAEDLYRACAQKVKQAPEKEQQSASTCDVCLQQLIVETLQARAHLHYKYQKWRDDAIECHELVVEALEEDNTSDDVSVDYNKIHFTVLPKGTRRELLIASLQSLGKFYVERGELEDGLMAYQETLKVLKEQDENGSPTQQRQDETSQIIRAL
jgi:tetratricopeptide (TPR) repeat protein